MKRLIIPEPQGRELRSPVLGAGIPPTLPEPTARVLLPDDPEERRQYAKLINRYKDGRFQLDRDVLAQEEEIDVILPYGEGYSLSRTPGDDRNLILGSLLTRAKIESLTDVQGLRFMNTGGREQAEVVLRSSAGQSSTGVLPLQDTRRERLRVSSVFKFREVFEKGQVVRRQTGATHGAALFDISGNTLAFGEDVGRHNALDKAIGNALESDMLGQCSVAMLSSRLALELVLKAVSCSIPILAGFSVATASAVECAQSCGITLVGRLRPGTLNVYTHSWRLV